MSDDRILDEKKLDGATGGTAFPKYVQDLFLDCCPVCHSGDVTIGQNRQGERVIRYNGKCKKEYPMPKTRT